MHYRGNYVPLHFLIEKLSLINKKKFTVVNPQKLRLFKIGMRMVVATVALISHSK